MIFTTDSSIFIVRIVTGLISSIIEIRVMIQRKLCHRLVKILQFVAKIVVNVLQRRTAAHRGGGRVLILSHDTKSRRGFDS